VRVRRRGLSLIEVMVAGALLGVGAAGTLSAWGTVTTLLERQRRVTDATSLARSSIERLLALAPGDPALDPGDRIDGHFDVFGAPLKDGGYIVRHKIAANQPAAGFIKLTVDVQWSDLLGSRSVTISTFRER
jgi:prepilin-type N-terminal cleavage/methylation domain-containing protein